HGTLAEGNPCTGELDTTIAFGASQSGHFLRHFLYLGLNEDEAGRHVFDGVFALIGSARRGEFNMRFGQPAKTLGRYTGALFPFADAVQSDPVSGETDGLLSRLSKSGKAPRTFIVDSSAEYWSRQASLIHTDVQGSRDIDIPESTRIYQIA